MKIWILNHYAIPPKYAGGTRHFDFAKELVKQGHEVTIFASSFNHLLKEEMKTYTDSDYLIESYEGVSFVWIKTPSYFNSINRIKNMVVFARKLNKIMQKMLLGDKPNLIIGSSVHPLTPLVGMRNAKKSNIPFFFEERDLWPQTFIDFDKMTKKNWIYKILLAIEKKLYFESDKIIFLFEKAYLYAKQLGVDEKKIMYLPNGFSKERLNSQPSESTQTLLNKYKHKKLCIYVGSMGIANNMDPIIELIELMKNDDDYFFLLFGDGPLKKDYVKLVEDLNLKNVYFCNPIPKTEIPMILSHGHCGLLSIKNSPLYKWGMSMNKIYDYLSVGLPIVTYTDMTDLGTIENTKGVYKSDDITVLREIILNLENTELKKKEIAQIADKLFSWENLSESFLLETENFIKQKEGN